MHLVRWKHIPGQLTGYTDFLGMNDVIVDVARVFSNSHMSLVWHCDWAWDTFSATINRRLNLDVISINGGFQGCGLMRSPGESCNITKRGHEQVGQQGQLMSSNVKILK